MDFSNALRAAVAGSRISRANWNGKGMFVTLQRGNVDFDSISTPSGAVPSTISGVHTSLFDAGDKGTITRMPNFNMRAADGSTVVGWLASQTDMLAVDWTADPPLEPLRL